MAWQEDASQNGGRGVQIHVLTMNFSHQIAVKVYTSRIGLCTLNKRVYSIVSACVRDISNSTKKLQNQARVT